ncbi:unnamed protein product [Phyllotreta striolata]|uniref:Rhythmically expressed gene 5 protein n=1 Tax=Phyllotreta striolata TaxID=444603 RepID=A0A9N9XPW4_PHYSR|nr:unnamed protein product [Phyllotreta striolata]
MNGFELIFGVLVMVAAANSSAIPMWEYLSKQEKMSFLYSVFAKQVEHFCEESSLDNCNRQLLKYGLDKLKNLPEEYLDSMDPYQRGANQFIWDTMMAGHPSAGAIPAARSTTTAKPNSYEDDRFDDFEFGSTGSASAKIDNVAILPATRNILEQYGVKPRPWKVAGYSNGAYGKFQRHYPAPVDPMEEESYPEAPLTGPMVVRVHMDGTPVETNAPLPQDEDLRQYQMSQVRIPNF